MGLRSFAILLLATPLMAQPAGSSIVQRSGFIFRGTVQEVGASNVKAVPRGPRTLVVKVDEILKSPQTLEALKGKTITVQQQRNTTLKKGQQAVFYTTGWMYGENVAVKEVGTVSARVSNKTLQDQIALAEQQTADQALAARIANSPLVITGKVREITPLISKEESARRSEHDPEMWRAIVEIATVEKGTKPELNTVPVLFAHSTDERWYFSPKYSPDDEGIFLLHAEPAAANAGAYSTLDRLDFQPSNRLDLVRRLIKSGR